MIILIFLVLISFSIGLFFSKRINVEKTLPYTFMSIVIFMFALGLIGLLKYSVYFIFIVSLFIWFYIIYKFIFTKNKVTCLKNLFSPGFVFFICIFVFLYFYHNGRLLTNWDEFSHWGDVVKAMYNINDFSTSNQSLSAFQTYLPGMSLFQYFFQFFLHQFNESYLFISYQVFSFSLFLPFFEKVKWNEIFKIVLSICLIGLSFIILYSNFYKTIYIDCFLGMVFGFNLINIFLFKDKYNKTNIFKLSISLIMLVLTKDMGLFLAFICIFIIFVMCVINSIKNKKFKISDYYFVFGFCFLIFFIYFLWQFKIKISGSSMDWSNPLDIKFILQSLMGVGNSYGVLTRKNYINRFNNFPIIGGYLHLNCLSLTILLCFIFFNINSTNDGSKKRNNYIFISIIVGFYIYLFLLLVLYLWKFTEYEAVSLASWERYVASYLQGIIFFIVSLVINQKYCKRNILNLLLVFTILFTCVDINTIKSYARRGIFKTIQFRQPYEYASELLGDKLGSERARVYFISQASQGFDYWVFKFGSRKNLSYINTGYSWSLGEKYYDGDIWSYDIKKEEWMDELINSYDYVYLYIIDERFIDDYGSLFKNKSSISNNTVYKIDKKNRILIEI